MTRIIIVECGARESSQVTVMQNKDMMGIHNDLPDELGNVMIIISQCLQSKAFFLT